LWYIINELYKGILSVMKLKIILEKSDEGGYTAYVPSLPGCISEGDTEKDAIKNIQEAIELYLEPVDDDWVFDKTRSKIREISL
jgi:predicted RNase H-like HicB family nuclease